MKFSTIFSLCMVGGAIAAPVQLQKRDDKWVREALQHVQPDINQLERHLQGNPGRNEQESRVFISRALELQDKVTGTLKYAADYVHNGPDLSVLEFAGLSSWTGPLTKSQGICASQWIKLKPYVNAVGAHQATLKAMEDVNREASRFLDSIWHKTNGITAALTTGFKSSILNDLGRAVTEYRKP
ncbi:hypothetical protein BT63DRAFT_52587 [Microthyrium microscopicum]|uniref:Uncharacterized protein n=1 Tax=Microthyrium microscopicum TaxID=703497 RepID=A0A6A6U429_9PEZI|nr:hypothetical protein BT63DRAFT_52587 [Microthyrium microscopicum]